MSLRVCVLLWLSNPTQTTQAAYIRVPMHVRAAVQAAGLPFRDGLHAAAHAILNVLPLFLPCEAVDVTTECDNPYRTTYRPERLLIYDRHPGGIGLAARVCWTLGMHNRHCCMLRTFCAYPCAL